MYRTFQIDVRPGHPQFECFEKLSVANTNMYNTALFVCRQVLSGVNKDPDQRQENELAWRQRRQFAKYEHCRAAVPEVQTVAHKRVGLAPEAPVCLI